MRKIIVLLLLLFSVVSAQWGGWTHNYWLKNGSNIYYNKGYVGIGLSSPTQQFEITKNFKLTNTTNSNKFGIIYKSSIPFLHDFNYGNNGTVTTNGYNLFVGNAGNLTMGSTATLSTQSSYNVGIGYEALKNNTTGYYNTSVGVYALVQNTTGRSNTAVGEASLYGNLSGIRNTALGKNALYSTTTGGNNIGIGYDAGRFLSDGSTTNTASNFSIYIGNSTKSSSATAYNEIVIGYNAVGLGNHTVVIGNDNIVKTVLKGQVGIATTTPDSGTLQIAASGTGVHDFYVGDATTFSYIDAGGGVITSSDSTLKENIIPLTKVINSDELLNKILEVRAVQYNWRSDSTKEKKWGMIAQEFGKVFENNPDAKNIDWQKVAAIQWYAIQELIRRIKNNEQRIKLLGNK